ncbi:hypothetical protein ACJX0J_029038 [Zea mays]
MIYKICMLNIINITQIISKDRKRRNKYDDTLSPKYFNLHNIHFLLESCINDYFKAKNMHLYCYNDPSNFQAKKIAKGSEIKKEDSAIQRHNNHSKIGESKTHNEVTAEKKHI